MAQDAELKEAHLVRRWIWLVLIVIVASVTWRVWAMRRAGAPGPQPEIAGVPVEVAPVRTQTLVATVTAGGSVEAFEDVSITAKIPGRVAQVYAREGEGVRAGQVLARLETAEISAQVRQAEAALDATRARLAMLEQGARPQERAQVEATVAQAAANFESAKANYARMQALYESGAVSKAQLDAAALQRDVAQAQLDAVRQQQSLVRTGPRPEETAMARAQVAQAQAAVQLARLQIANSAIASPLRGVVTRRAIDPGEMAAPGVMLFSVAQIDAVYVTLDLSETDLGKVRAGQPAAIRVDAYPDRVFRGTVHDVAQTGDPRSRVFKAKVVVANPGHVLRPGMFARSEITVGRTEGALVIPRDAVSTDSGRPVVFVAAGGTAHMRTVQLGGTYGPVVQILGGLRAGESVIVSGQSGLTDGSAVTIR